MVAFQAFITTVVMVWCLWQISVKDRDNRQDMTAYWSTFSSLISYWLPSPIQSQSQFRNRKDD
jgi:hypothetical protein